MWNAIIKKEMLKASLIYKLSIECLLKNVVGCALDM